MARWGGGKGSQPAQVPGRAHHREQAIRLHSGKAMDGWMGPFETPEERSQSSRLGSGSPVQSHPVARIARPGLLPLDTALRSRNSGQAPAVSCSRRRALGRGRVTASSTAGQEERKRKARVGLTPIYLIHSIQPSIPASSSLFFFFFFPLPSVRLFNPRALDPTGCRSPSPCAAAVPAGAVACAPARFSPGEDWAP